MEVRMVEEDRIVDGGKEDRLLLSTVTCGCQ